MPTDAAELIAALTWPDVHAEEWRYSRVEEIDVASYAPSATEAGDLPAGASALRDSVSNPAAVVVLRNGRPVSVDVDPTVSAAGLSVRFASQIDPPIETDCPEVDAFVTLNANLADPVVIEVARGAVIEAPILVVSWIDEPDTLAATRVVVYAAENSEVTVIERAGGDSPRALSVPVTSIVASPSSRVRHLSTQQLGAGITQVGFNTARVLQQATLDIGHVALGGSYARLRFDCLLDGRGAAGSITTLYAGDGDQMHDLRTFQRHAAQDTTSNLLFKGSVDDRAHAVYTGNIHITTEGRGSNATQTNRIVKLSPEAWAESVPNLEIEHNDVKCSHASTVGPIDHEQRFYLESRGVRPSDAERLVVNGFYAEVLGSMPTGVLNDELSTAVTAKVQTR